MNLHPIFQAALAPVIPPSMVVWRQRQAEIEAADAMVADPYDDTCRTCHTCDGTGEGMSEDTVCGVCRGKGVVPA